MGILMTLTFIGFITCLIEGGEALFRKLATLDDNRRFRRAVREIRRVF